MPRDTFTVTSTTGFGTRLQQSGKAACCAPILIIIASILLFWNEGRAVARYQDLQETSRNVVELDPSTYQTDLDGKLVHATALATAESTVEDSTFGVSVEALRLRRNVLMYQWVEQTHSKEEKQTGGSTKTTTTYDYSTMWKSSPINSDNFNFPQDHENPSSMKFSPSTWAPSPVFFGAYTLDNVVTNRFNWWTTYQDVSLDAIPDGSAASGAQMDGTSYYYGANPASPTVGDTKVSFEYVPETQVSIVAQQGQNSFGSYTTKRGGSVLLVSQGTVSAEAMIAQAEAENEMMTWFLRFVGFLLMWIGLSNILRPFITFVDVIPCLGNMLESGVSLLSFLGSALVSTVIVALAWLFYRPLLSVPLLCGVAGAVYYAVKKNRENQSTAVQRDAASSTKYDQVELAMNEFA